MGNPSESGTVGLEENDGGHEGVERVEEGVGRGDD